MKLRTILLPVLASIAACATAAPPLPAGETAIPFVRSTGVLDWRVVADNALYIQGGNNRWYLVRTMNRCTRLYPAISLGFVTSALDQLDRHGAIIAQGQRCPIASVIRSAPPPVKTARR